MICDNCKCVVSRVIVTDRPQEMASMSANGQYIRREGLPRNVKGDKATDTRWVPTESVMAQILCAECEYDVNEAPMEQRDNPEWEPAPYRSDWQDTNGFRAYIQNKINGKG
jgi:hypothetical protein